MGLSCAFGAYFMLAAYKRMRVFPLLRQSAVVFLLVGSANLIPAWCRSPSAGPCILLTRFCIPPPPAPVLWRPLCTALRWTQHRFLVR